MRHPFQLFITCVFLLSVGMVTAEKKRPNVLLILSDDHNFRALGCSGNKAIRTPNLDRLAEGGVFFNRCFTPNPICGPARACIYTGQDSWTSGCIRNGNPIGETAPRLPDLLAKAGYETSFVGKWHNDGKPWTRGYSTGGRCWAGGKFDQFEMALTDFGGGPETRKPAEKYSSEVFTDDAVDYLNRDHSKPFLMVLAYTVGHDAFLAPPGFEGKYSPESIPLPPNFMAKPPFTQFNPLIRDETVLPFPRVESDVLGATAEYYAMFEHLDEQVGRLLKTLKRKGIDKETMVIFASVKGLSLGSHGIIGKQTMYEEGIRSSLIIRHPTLQPAAGTNRELVSTLDILPTICDAAGISVPPSVEGRSLLGLYEGRGKGRDQLFFSYHDPVRFTVTRAVRTSRYKLIHHLISDERELFDLSNDPYEIKNLISSEQSREIESELTAKLLQWRTGTEEK
jgi:arylsulfatase A-like enzyme